MGQLVATDISATALDRARARCEAAGNISFELLDLARDPLPDGLDLIVCSEVLYYLEDVEELDAVAQRLAGPLLGRQSFPLTRS